MTAATLLRAARLEGGVNQATLAERAGTRQPNVSLVERGVRSPAVQTLERFLAAAGHRLISIKTPYADAVETAEQVRASLADGKTDTALRRLIDYSDGLSASDPVIRVVLTAAEPAPTGSALWDATLAGIAEYWLNRGALPKPGWLAQPRRSLPVAEALLASPYDVAPDPSEVPREFLERNVLVSPGQWASV